jgi:iron complex outermembrane receptor protein
MKNLKKTRISSLQSCCVLFAGALASAGVWSQEPAEDAVVTEEKVERSNRQMEEVVVTVERRSESLQDYAGTAVSFTGEALKMQGIQNLTDLSDSTPGVEINNKQGNVEIWIRGIGSSNNTELGDPAAATHLDGVYIPRPTGIGSAFFDIARVEVNIGPQGTLRGRNATAGSVNIVPWRPAIGQFNGGIEVEGGNYNQRLITGAINIPVSDTTAVRLAGYKMEHDPYYNDVGPLDLDLAEAADNEALRLQGIWEPNDRLSVLVAGDYLREKGSGYTGSNYANPLGNGIDPDDVEDPRDVWGRGFEPENNTTHWGIKLEVDYDLGFANLEYIGSFRFLDYSYQASTPLTPDYQGAEQTLQPLEDSLDNWSRFQFLTEDESIIHELRLVSPDHDRFYYTAGLFYFKEDQKSFLASTGDRGGFFQGAEFNQPDTNAESYSAYGDVTYNLTEQTRITGGLRFTHDEKSRRGVNARYAFALGGFDVTDGDEFGCCMGARIGTEGFAFAGFDRTIYDGDIDGNGETTEDEFLEFYFDGIGSFGDRDNVDDIFANGPLPGGSENPAQCTDTDTSDGLICPADGNFSFAVPISPDNSITVQDGEMKEEFVDWRIRVGHDINDTSMGYAMVSTGHKSGGFNDTFADPEIGANISPTYDTEQVTMYEIGMKNEFELGDVLTQFNVSAFYYDYTDQVFTSILSVEQALEFASGGASDPADVEPGALVVSFSFNAADSQIYGMQFEGKFELPYNINLSYTALWLEAEIKDAEDIQDSRFQADVAPEDAVFRSIDGKRLPHTPRYQFNVSFSQFVEIPWGSIDYVLSAGWRDEQFLTIYNGEDYGQPDDPRLRLDDTVPAYWTFDAGLGYSHGDGALRFEAYANNFTDEVKNAASIITQFDNTRFFSRPVTYGARVRYSF